MIAKASSGIKLIPQKLSFKRIHYLGEEGSGQVNELIVTGQNEVNYRASTVVQIQEVFPSQSFNEG